LIFSNILGYNRPVTEYACGQKLKFASSKVRRVGRPAVRWLDSVEETLKMWALETETKVIGSGPMESNNKIGQGSLWSVAPLKKKNKKKKKRKRKIETAMPTGTWIHLIDAWRSYPELRTRMAST
jgi:hypothetical protein